MNLVRHVRSIRHLQMEQLYQMRRQQEGIDSPADISLIFLVTDSSESLSSSDSISQSEYIVSIFHIYTCNPILLITHQIERYSYRYIYIRI